MLPLILVQEGFAAINEGTLVVGLTGAHIQLPAKADMVVID